MISCSTTSTSATLEDALKLKAETYDIKHPIEAAEDEATKPKPAEKTKSPMDLKFMDDPILYVREKVQLFLTIAKRDPIEAIKFVPEVAGGFGVLIVTLLAVIVGAIGMTSATPQAQQVMGKAKDMAATAQDKASDVAAAAKDQAAATKDQATAAKDQAVAAANSGADRVQAEVNKRTTRSSAAAE